MSLTKAERAFLKEAQGPHEKAYEAKITLKFLADPNLDFETVLEGLLAQVRGDLGGITMKTKRTATHINLTQVDL